jgi:hypothetical protein
MFQIRVKYFLMCKMKLPTYFGRWLEVQFYCIMMKGMLLEVLCAFHHSISFGEDLFRNFDRPVFKQWEKFLPCYSLLNTFEEYGKSAWKYSALSVTFWSVMLFKLISGINVPYKRHWEWFSWSENSWGTQRVCCPIVSQMNPFTPSHPIFWRSILVLSSYLWLGLPNDLIPSGFLPKYLYEFIMCHVCYMPCTFYPPWLYHK